MLLWLMLHPNVVTLQSIINSWLNWNKSLEATDLKFLLSPAINLEVKSLKILKLFANGHLIIIKQSFLFLRKCKWMEAVLILFSAILSSLQSKIQFHGILTNFWFQVMENLLNMPLQNKQNLSIFKRKSKDFSNDSYFNFKLNLFQFIAYFYNNLFL